MVRTKKSSSASMQLRRWAVVVHVLQRDVCGRLVELCAGIRVRPSGVPRFRGHLIAGPSGSAARIDVHAVNPAVFA